MRKAARVLMFASLLVSICQRVEANIVFPAVAHQFMVSLVIPGYYSVVLAILVVFTEAFFIKKLFKEGWAYGLTQAFLVNLVSSIAGVFIVAYFEVMTREMSMGVLGYENNRLGTYLGMIPGYFITVALEGACLLAVSMFVGKKSTTAQAVISVCLLMNAISYGILSLGILVADVATHGQNFVTS